MSVSKRKYQDQDATMTLREGIDEYYAANPRLLSPPSVDEEAVKFFKCHDRIHVVFGCDTSFLNELRTDFWTLFGSDVGVIRYLSFLKHPAIQLLAKDLKSQVEGDPTLREAMKADIKRSAKSALATPIQIFARTRKMRKKWPWVGNEGLLDKSLRELRAEYGIEVFH